MIHVNATETSSIDNLYFLAYILTPCARNHDQISKFLAGKLLNRLRNKDNAPSRKRHYLRNVDRAHVVEALVKYQVNRIDFLGRVNVYSAMRVIAAKRLGKD